MLSEARTRVLNKYIITLVKRQPSWLRRLFEEEQIVFGLENDEKTLVMHVSKDLNPNHKEQAQKLISSYIDKHPCDAFKLAEIH